MKLHFTKMHGCGNDYIYINCFREKVNSPDRLAVRLSRRHFSVGADGIILICPSETADVKMVMYNSDGSQGKMCGNGIRCVGKYVYDRGIAEKSPVTVETASGIKTLDLIIENGAAAGASVDMGKAELRCEKIPVRLPYETAVSVPQTFGDDRYLITCVGMGNPHCVIFRDDIDGMDVAGIGSVIEHSSLFPEGVNTEFVRVCSENEIGMRVWERGSGETLACGTGACAAAVASVLNGYCKKGENITVHLPGGDLEVRYTDGGVTLTGPAAEVFEGTVETEV